MVSWLSDAFSAVMKWISDEAPIIVSAVIQPCESSSTQVSRQSTNHVNIRQRSPILGSRRLGRNFPRPADSLPALVHRTCGILLRPDDPRIRDQRHRRWCVDHFSSNNELIRTCIMVYLRIGSPAALYQSLCYGGNTPSASLFAILQSIGMKYHAVTLGSWLLAVVRLIAALVFLYVAFFVLW